jgi:hypothetical protein
VISALCVWWCCWLRAWRNNEERGRWWCWWWGVCACTCVAEGGWLLLDWVPAGPPRLFTPTPFPLPSSAPPSPHPAAVSAPALRRHKAGSATGSAAIVVIPSGSGAVVGIQKEKGLPAAWLL